MPKASTSDPVFGLTRPLRGLCSILTYWWNQVHPPFAPPALRGDVVQAGGKKKSGNSAERAIRPSASSHPLSPLVGRGWDRTSGHTDAPARDVNPTTCRHAYPLKRERRSSGRSILQPLLRWRTPSSRSSLKPRRSDTSEGPSHLGADGGDSRDDWVTQVRKGCGIPSEEGKGMPAELTWQGWRQEEVDAKLEVALGQDEPIRVV